MTQLSFSGSYEEQEEGYPRVRYGRTPQRTIERQVHAGFWVSHDGAVPLRGQGFDGNAEDRQAVEPALERLDAIRAGLPQGEPPLVVGDSKLLSAANVRAFCERGLRFLCPHPKDAALTARLAQLEQGELRPLAYAAERYRGRAPRYFAGEGRLSVAGRELRALFVLSLDDQAAASKQRAKQLARAEHEIAQLNRGVPRYTKDAAALERKAVAKLERRRSRRFCGSRSRTTQTGARKHGWSATSRRSRRRCSSTGATAWSRTTRRCPPTSCSRPTNAST